MEMVKESNGVGKKIIVGVCVMEKKVKCGTEVLFYFIEFFTRIQFPMDEFV